MLRQLIVNADDFGYTPGVSRGILQAHQQGIVTSTSVMVNVPAAADWVPRARQDAPDLGLGLHLTLTAGPPAAAPDAVPDLLQPGGTFYSRSDLLPRLPTIDMAQVERELRAQIARFETIAGQLPDHLDSHHHITYLNPPLFALMIQLATELDVPIRKPIPGTRAAPEEAAAAISRFVSGLPGPAYVDEMVSMLRGGIEGSSVPTPDYFIAAFYGEQAILGDLLLLLLEVPEGTTELMCHPGHVDDDLRAQSSYTERRADELAALTHASAREVIQSEFIQLISYSDL